MVIKYRRLKWADHVARIEEGSNALNIWIGNQQETKLERPRGQCYN